MPVFPGMIPGPGPIPMDQGPLKTFAGFRPLVGLPGVPHSPKEPSNDEIGGNESDMESSVDGGSENGELNELDSSKMDPAHREFLEKLKRQEQEERKEIEKELKELKEHREALARRSEELRAQESQAHPEQRDRSKHALDHGSAIRNHEQENEIKIQRPEGLLAHHGLKPPVAPERSNIDMLSHHAAYMDRAFSRSPPTNDMLASSPAHHWTFEEQFKQLYELSEDPKRKEFLDDLFSFMQKRGTPVNRIPIMAKQTLDLFELFKLVVSKGGLVEVINKKLWREITKGLNLPSSITSAAFTLRTQYMKYLYPYECEKLKLSSPQELQAAIDGNRREGRRPSYGYDLSPGPPLMPQTSHLNGGILNGRPGTVWDTLSAYKSLHNGTTDLPTVLPLSSHLWWTKLTNLCGDKSPPPPEERSPPSTGDDDGSLPTTPTHMRSNAERDARAMEAATRAMEEATKRMEEASRVAVAIPPQATSAKNSSKSEEPPMKRPATEEERLMNHVGMPGAHIKITSRNDGRSEFDNSLVVSMEINGIMYQGVLFAQQPGQPRRV